MVRSLAPAVVVAPPPPPPPTEQTVPAGRRFVNLRNFQEVAVERPMMSRMAVSEFAQAPAVVAAPSAPAVAPVAASYLAVNADHPQLQMAAWRTNADVGLVAAKVSSQVLFQNFLPVQTVTTSTSSTVTIHLEHQCVTLGYFTAGQPWWNGVFLADQGWFMPGMPRGGLLPPADGAPDATFGLPVGLVIVQNLRVSGQWSAEAAAALSSPGGTIGPLSLFGATASTEADGVTMTYSHDGMQVVALLCNPLPVLPPVDPPSATTPDPAPVPADPQPAPPTPPPPDAPAPPAPPPPAVPSDPPPAPPADPPAPVAPPTPPAPASPDPPPAAPSDPVTLP
jgi:hypothetical protein